jgi:hypothetical protein
MIAAVLRVLSTGFALLALVGFVAAVVVHGAALGGSNLLGDAMTGLFVLHGGIFVVMLPLLAVTFFDYLRGRRTAMIRGRVAGLATAALFLYCLATLFWVMRGVEAGTVAMGDSPAAMLTSTRVFSSAWLLFYFVALAFFLPRALSRD